MEEQKKQQQQQFYSPPHEHYSYSSPQQQQQEKDKQEAPYYGTFQGTPQDTTTPSTQQHDHHAVPVYPVLERHLEDLPPLPCCGIGIGWFLFILGFFIASVPWYAGAILLLCTRPDPRERIGFICCTIAAILSLVVAIIGGTTATY